MWCYNGSMRNPQSAIRNPAARASRSGQAMLVATLAIGGAILGATSLAGLLLLYQIRATTDSVNSAKAIFAADSGAEWAFYTYFNSPPSPNTPPTVLGNGATTTIICYNGRTPPAPVHCNNAPATTTVRSEGNSNGSRRAFFYDLTNATATLP